MRFTQLFGRTLRQPPTSTDLPTGLACRAALTRLVDDQLVLLPLGERVLQRLAEGLQSSLPDAQSIGLPVGFSNHELRTILQGEIQSYRQLPVMLRCRRFQRMLEPPLGLARPTGCDVFDWIVVTESDEALESQRVQWGEIVLNWFETLDIVGSAADWQPDMYGWVSIQEHGPEALLACQACDYLARLQAARFALEPIPREPLEEVSTVSTPGCDTIAALAEYLAIPENKTLKAVFLATEEDVLVFAILRGDLEISLVKLMRAIDCQSLRPATEDQIRAAGVEPGYASPVGLSPCTGNNGVGVLVVGDPSIESGYNFITGANKPGFHLTGINYPRDFSVTILADIAEAKESYGCPECGEPMTSRRGIFLGSWQKLAGVIHHTGRDGREDDAFAGIGTILLQPLMAALLVENHDEHGIIWPTRVAPYDIHLIDLRCPEQAVVAFQELSNAGFSVVLDDRDVSPGVKFTDADLIGCPLRVTVSRRSQDQGGIELSLRGGELKEIVPLNKLGEAAQVRISEIM